ncbi:MAG: bifunctional diaminohydroxyphosphoribosylaminopyrimidine deaminase/5-amino-6-(5-phosphoribosylamino)uracil reductase RibD [Succiniclasticum sp.]|jgi:diaminohydroxyphosphoribosylaminopyrimidine deaminase/5-amino-6-(5-phosphoribosylamino)uracil reductase|nr:bifunctional diaminohydroxyphosphoribosylaminopyrimidine deaminase/5-amino-6-(5-phosphoribosylamino)uracil reductase RibD [Succiniclasticum sp.]
MVFLFPEGDSMDQDEFYMKRALELARKAEGETSPNPMVGCVILDAEGRVAGEGWHHKAGQPHAEIMAMEDMKRRKMKGCTAYVSLEPCSHYGRTGPCCDALIRAGFKRVVAAMVDPNPKVAGQGLQRLRDAGIEVRVGVCEEEARRLNEKFLLWVTEGRPFVSLKFAETLDGKLATRTRDSHYVTGDEAHRFSHWLRKTHDAILVGIGTVLDDDPALTTRLVKGKNPVRVVLDSKARIPLTAQVLQDGGRTILAVGPGAPADKLEVIGQLPSVEIVTLPCTEAGRVDLTALLAELNARDITSVLVEGGSEVLGSFLDARLADRVYAFIAPKLAGGARALPAVGGKGAALMEDCALLDETECKALGSDWLLTGRVRFPGRQ